ncbi:hypothetical protein ACEWY4_004222 [Coilia grayii]|uniref:Myb-like domain-containing protein n=1 Tax=Coilia grayii TaxID=363190 RepID=A0ABD1KLZ4_9TELE
MIRRSRISVRPNVRPGSRPTASSQDASKQNQDLSSSSLEQTETTSEQPVLTSANAPNIDTQKPEPETSAPSKHERVSQGCTPVPEPQWKKTAINQSLPQPHQTTAVTNTDNDTPSPQPPSPQTSTSSSKSCTTSVKPFSSRSTANTEIVPSTSSEQVKADDKVSRRPKSRPTLPAVPRQSKVKPREDVKRHAQQQKDIKSLEKGNAEILELDVFETGASKEGSSATPHTTSTSEKLKDKETAVSSASEKLKDKETAVSSASEKVKHKQTEVKSTTRHSLNDPADLIRLGKAKKLRELLKLEICKERNQKTLLVKTKRIQYDTAKDPSKMTMRELIYYLPKTNPMNCSSEERSPQPKQQIQQCVAEPEPEQRHEEEEEAAFSDPEASEPLLVPQVKVAEDGSLIIDEQSLTVEVQRMQGPNPTEDRDPVFERGSTTTYSSFRKGSYTKPWSSQETDMFFLAISMVGTDFSMIGSMFPHRARSEIKNKFKKEERANAWRIDKAFREKRRLDLEFFTELLEKILADEERRKRNHSRSSVGAKGSQRRERKKPRAKKSKKAAPDSEESAEEDLIDITEGEKENEDRLSEQGSGNCKTTKNSKEAADLSPKRKSQTTLDTDPDRPDADQNSQEDGRGSPMKNTQICDGRRKSSRKARTKIVQNSSDDGDCGTEETTKASTQIKRRSEESLTSKSRRCQKKDVEVNEEAPSRTTRLKRKRPQPKIRVKERGTEKRDRTLTQSSDDNSGNESQTKPDTVRRGNKKKRTGLVTLRASVSEEDIEVQEAEMQEPGVVEGCEAENVEDQNQAPAFVPKGLRSPSPVIAEVEETLEEEAMDFLAQENLEESEESYKEAAQTLLTIGDPCHTRRSAYSPEKVANQEDAEEHPTGTETDTESPAVSSESEITIGQNLEQAAPISTSGTQLSDANSEKPMHVTSDEQAEELPSATDIDIEGAAVSLESETSLCGTPSIEDNLEQGATNVSQLSDANSEEHVYVISDEQPPSATDIDTEEAAVSLESEASLCGISLIAEHLEQGATSVSQLLDATREEPMYMTSDEQADDSPSCTDTNTERAAVSFESGTSLCGMSAIREHLEQGAADVSQLSDPNSDEPIYIISLTEITPSFMETLPSDTDPPLSHSELLMCNPQPLSSQSETLPSDTMSLSCLADTFPPSAESLPSYTEVCSPSSEHLTSLIKPHGLVRDVETSPIERQAAVGIDPVTVTEPLSALTEPCPTTSQWNMRLEVSGKAHVSETDRKAVAALLTADAVLPQTKEGKDERGEMQEQSDLPSTQTSTSCLPEQAPAALPVSQICPAVKPSCTQFTGALLETKVESECGTKRIQIESERNTDLKAPDDDSRAVSHMIVIDALVPVEAEVEKHGESEETLTTASTSTENAVKSTPPDVDGVTEEEPPPTKRNLLKGTRRAKVQVKPALTARRNKSQNSSEETPTPPVSTTQSSQMSHIASTQSSSTQLPAAPHQPPSTTGGVSTEESPVVQNDTSQGAINFTSSDLRAPEDDSRAVSHMIVIDALVPVEAEVEKHGESEEVYTTASSSTENVVRSEQSNVDCPTEEEPPPAKRKVTRRGKVQVKPALTGRRNVSQNTSKEKTTPPISSTQPILNIAPAQSSSMQLSAVSHHQPPSTTGGVCTQEPPVLQNTEAMADDSRSSDWRVPVDYDDDSRAVSHMIVTDALVPVEAEVEKHGESEETLVDGSEQPDVAGLPEEEPPPAKRKVTRRAKVQVKPALTGRRNVSQNVSKEASTPPISSAQPILNIAPAQSRNKQLPALSHQPPSTTDNVCTQESPVVQNIQPMADNSTSSDWRAPVDYDDDSRTVSHMIVIDALVPVEAEVEKHGESEETLTTASSSTGNVVRSEQPDVAGLPEEEPPPAKRKVTRRAKVQVKPALTTRRNVSQNASEETSTPPISSTQPILNIAPAQSRNKQLPAVSHQPPSTTDNVCTQESPVVQNSDWRAPVDDDDSRAVSHMIVIDALVPVEAEVEKHGESEETLTTANSSTENVVRSEQPGVGGLPEEKPPPAKRKVTRRAKVQVKPALKTRRNVSQNASGETSTPPITSTQPSAQSSSMQLPALSHQPSSTAGGVCTQDSPVVQNSDWRAPVDDDDDDDDDDSRAVSHMIVTDALVPVEAEVEKHGESEETLVDRSAQPDVTGLPEEEPPPAKRKVTRRAKVQVKPALTTRRTVSQNVSEETSTPAIFSTQPILNIASAKSSSKQLPAVSHQPPLTTGGVCMQESPVVQNIQPMADNSISSDWRAPVDDDDDDDDDSRAVSHMIVIDALVPVEAEVEKHGESEETLTTASSSTENVVRSEQPGVTGPPEEEPPPAKRKVTRRAKAQVKPDSSAHRTVSESASEETSTPPISSTQPILNIASAQSSSMQLPAVSHQPPSTTDGVCTQESPVVQNTPQAPTTSMSRPGRRPKGFLSFMSGTSVSGVSAAKPPQVKAAPSRRACVRPRIAPSATDASASTSSSLTSTSDTVTPKTSTSGAGKAVAVIPRGTTSSPVNHEVISSESKDSSIRHQSEEPTSISEYFLSNIFTEVEEVD